MLSFITGLIKTTTPFLVILNFFSGIIGGVWLLFSGEWKLVLLSFLISLSIPTLYSIVTMPFSFIFEAGASYFADKQKKVPVIVFGAINILIHNIIELFWVFIIFFYMIAQADISGISIIPFLLYGYDLALL